MYKGQILKTEDFKELRSVFDWKAVQDKIEQTISTDSTETG